MAATNPMFKLNERHPDRGVSKTYTCAGLKTTVYGLDTLPPEVTELACLWLLHPRLQTQACMAPVALAAIREWNARSKRRASGSGRGLIAVSFDQRNHGSRLVDPLANEAWRQGNPRHAIDMFSIYQGTSVDLSHLITHLHGYISPDLPASKPRITANLALGVSLGGHAVWHSVLHDSRMSAVVSVIGCPDYASLMSERARLSKRPSFVGTNPPGSNFFGSEDFPPALVEAVRAFDPAGLLSPLNNGIGELGFSGQRKVLSTNNVQVLRSKFDKHLRGRAILCLSGGADKMVSPRCSEPFLSYLKAATGKEGFYEDGQVTVEEVMYDGVGHEMTDEMLAKATDWICRWLAGELRSRPRARL